ncbi:MAG: serine/threonine-protein kinase, partial [Myxococcota bacterium]
MADTIHLVGPDEATAVDAEASTPPGRGGLAAGDRIGRYVVVETVGQGAMGQVARAYDPKLAREVAIKRVRTELREGSAKERLVREARAMARLSHANVVPVYDVEPTDDGVALAMEYVSGGTLRDWMDAGPRTEHEVLRVLAAAGEGLAAAHRVELVHRDFKPANVLVSDDGRIKVTDFGLAKETGTEWSADGEPSQFSGSESLTREGTAMGTPRYMAPEQHEGSTADARADQFAFCVTLWEALVEAPPFAGKTLASLADQKRAGPPPWPESSAISPVVARAIRRGLATDPDRRWPSMRALLTELSSVDARRKRRRW